jgi:mannose-6-phosphate isomerase
VESYAGAACTYRARRQRCVRSSSARIRFAGSIAEGGGSELGLSRLDDGTRLRDTLAHESVNFFEPSHLALFGSEPAVLIKLLDAGERLPVHLHPGDAFAASKLGAPCGKTEAWIILDAGPGAFVHVGWSRELAEKELSDLVSAQDAEAMLAELNPLPVTAGDTIFVPAGLPHAIGAGILLLELQQPSDLSLLLERWSMSEAEAFLGLAPAVALSAVERSAPDLDRLRLERGTTLFPPEGDRFFRADLVAAETTLEPEFSVLVGYAGAGTLVSDSFEPVVIRRGSTILVPYAAGRIEVTGTCRAIRCRPRAAH